MPYFSGQGKCYTAERDASGNPKAFRFLGNVPELSLELSTEKTEHKESTTGQRMTDFVLHTSKNMAINFTLEEFTADNLAMALYGTKATVAGGPVVDEVVTSGLVAGDIIRTNHPKVSALTMEDTAGAPVLLTLGTHYRVISPDHGTLEILNVAAFTQPFTVSYTYASYTNLTMFTQPFKERYFLFDGLNTADTNRAVRIEVYRVQLDPLSEFSLLSDEMAQWPVSGTSLYDAARAEATNLGGFARILFT